MSIFYRFYLYFQVCNEMATYSDPMERLGNGRWRFYCPGYNSFAKIFGIGRNASSAQSKYKLCHLHCKPGLWQRVSFNRNVIKGGLVGL